MYNSTEKGRQINKFIYVAIPRPSDIFKRYGLRRINSSYTSAKGDINDIAAPADNSTISACIAGQKIYAKQVVDSLAAAKAPPSGQRPAKKG